MCVIESGLASVHQRADCGLELSGLCADRFMRAAWRVSVSWVGCHVCLARHAGQPGQTPWVPCPECLVQHLPAAPLLAGLPDGYMFRVLPAACAWPVT
jgi:hypothetical protein